MGSIRTGLSTARGAARAGAVAAAALLALPLLAQTPTTDGEVTKIDRSGGRITIKHEGVRNLDMPPMAMAFRVRSPQQLDALAVGSRVRFAAEKIDGQYTITALVKAP